MQFYGTKSTNKWQLINLFTWSINLKNAKSSKIMNWSQWLLFFWQSKFSKNAFFHQESIKIWYAQQNLLPKTLLMLWNVSKVKWKPDKILKKFKTYFLTFSTLLKKIPTVIVSWMYNLNCSSWLIKSSNHSMSQKFMMINHNVYFQTLQESFLMNLSIRNMTGSFKWLFWYFLTKDQRNKEKYINYKALQRYSSK